MFAFLSIESSRTENCDWLWLDHLLTLIDRWTWNWSQFCWRNFNHKIGSQFNSINERKFVLNCRFFILSNFHFQGRPTHCEWAVAKSGEAVNLKVSKRCCRLRKFWRKDERKWEKCCDVARKSRERNFGISFMRFYVPWNDFMVYKSVDHINYKIFWSDNTETQWTWLFAIK